MTGAFYDTASFGSMNVTSAGNTDVFVAKLDASGTFLWAESAGATSYDSGLDIAVDGAGNLYIADMQIKGSGRSTHPP